MRTRFLSTQSSWDASGSEQMYARAGDSASDLQPVRNLRFGTARLTSCASFRTVGRLTRSRRLCYHCNCSRGRNPLNCPRGLMDCGWRVPYKAALRDVRPMVGRVAPRPPPKRAGQVNVVHVSSRKRNRKFLNNKAGYGDASRVITWRILCLCFVVGSFRCPSFGVDSRVRHAYFLRESLREDSSGTFQGGR